jgi:hypothetical protein
LATIDVIAEIRGGRATADGEVIDQTGGDVLLGSPEARRV